MDKTIEQLEVELAQARSVAVAEARAWARVDSLEAEIVKEQDNAK